MDGHCLLGPPLCPQGEQGSPPMVEVCRALCLEEAGCSVLLVAPLPPGSLQPGIFPQLLLPAGGIKRCLRRCYLCENYSKPALCDPATVGGCGGVCGAGYSSGRHLSTVTAAEDTTIGTHMSAGACHRALPPLRSASLSQVWGKSRALAALVYLMIGHERQSTPNTSSGEATGDTPSQVVCPCYIWLSLSHIQPNP